jgi:hypothetical protein
MTMTRRSLFGLALAPLAPVSTGVSPTEFNRACRLAAAHRLVEPPLIVTMPQTQTFVDWFKAINPNPDFKFMSPWTETMWMGQWAQGRSPEYAQYRMLRWIMGVSPR